MAQYQTADKAKGKWRAILTTLGVSPELLNGEHQPCPKCGGVDRFRWDDNNQQGDFFCSNCGPGDGFTLLMNVLLKPFQEVALMVDGVVGECGYQAPMQKKDPLISLRKMQRQIMTVGWETPIGDYLKYRGLTAMPPGIRGAMSQPYYENGQQIAEYDSMVTPIRSVDGHPVTYHITYLLNGAKAPVRAPRKVMPPYGTINGAAARLWPHTGTLGVAEGIETAIAVHQQFKVPTWALINTNGMKTFDPPLGLVKLMIFGDNDANYAGQAAAYVLANRMAKAGIVTSVHIPKTEGFDWLDVLNEKEAK